MNDIYERLGFTATSVGVFSGAQGMDDLDDLGLLTDDEVDALCKLVLSPGGMIVNLTDRGAQIAAPDTKPRLRGPVLRRRIPWPG